MRSPYCGPSERVSEKPLTSIACTRLRAYAARMSQLRKSSLTPSQFSAFSRNTCGSRSSAGFELALRGIDSPRMPSDFLKTSVPPTSSR
jgi:hypothetical protein